MTADLIYGPQTEAVLVLIEQARALTGAEIVALAEAWDAWDVKAVGDAADVAVAAADATAAWSSVWGVAWAAGDAAGAAAMGLAVRHLIDEDTYRALTRLWALVHPDDSPGVRHD
jgi:hypothetical protein